MKHFVIRSFLVSLEPWFSSIPSPLWIIRYVGTRYQIEMCSQRPDIKPYFLLNTHVHPLLIYHTYILSIDFIQVHEVDETIYIDMFIA